MSVIADENLGKILKINSYEVALTCLIEKLKDNKKLEIHCVYTWVRGVEHANIDMFLVGKRFNSNAETTQKNNPNVKNYKI